MTFDDGDGYVDASFLDYIGDQGPDRFLGTMTPCRQPLRKSGRSSIARPEFNDKSYVIGDQAQRPPLDDKLNTSEAVAKADTVHLDGADDP